MSGSVYLTPFGRVKKFLFSQTLTEKITNSAILVIFVAFIVSEGLTTTFLFSGVLRIEMKAQLDKASTLLEYAQASPSSKKTLVLRDKNRFFSQEGDRVFFQEGQMHSLVGFGLCAEDGGRYILPLAAPFDPSTVILRYDIAGANIFNRVPETIKIAMAKPSSLILIENAFATPQCNGQAYLRVKPLTAGVGLIVGRAMLIRVAELAMFLLMARLLLKRVIVRNLANIAGYVSSKEAYGFSKKSLTDRFLDRASGRGKLIEEHFVEQARLASLGLATSKLTHDIRNLLSSLSLIAERLQQAEDEADKATAERMSLTVYRALTLYDWAAQYSQDKQRNIAIDKHNLYGLIEDVLVFVKQYDPRDKVQVINGIPANMQIWCDKTLLFRIIFNLSLNAVQAMQAQDSRGFLRITASKYNDFVRIDVSDGGPGMEPSDEDVFYAGSTYFSMKSRSTGLGLIIAQDIARWLGGEVKILNTGPSGTIMRVSVQDIAPPSLEAGQSSDIIDFVSTNDYKEPS